MKFKASVKTARLFGIIGSALGIFLLLTPSFGGIVNLLGSVLILAAVWSISHHTKNKKIFFFFILYVITISSIWLLTVVSAGYLLSVSEQGSVPIEARLLQALFVLLPIVSSFFLFKSYRKMGEEVDVRLFSVTAIVHVSFSIAISFLNLILLFTQSPLVASLGLLLTFISFLAIPVLGAISYIMIRPSVITYRSRT